MVWRGDAKLGERGYCHTVVAARGDRQVAETFLPIIHFVFSNLKTWSRGIHHGVSPQHPQAYLNEFTFRFNRRFYPFNAFRALLGITADVTAPTYAELYAAKSRPIPSSGCLLQPAKTLSMMHLRSALTIDCALCECSFGDHVHPMVTCMDKARLKSSA